ncbi:MAG TPA: hypothetical protein VHJ83_06980 [Micromonosporaceae bacterium]|jgi:hypothetical protein|nr:hypothetical protein [Micromonosporaceae bacterium]
MSDRLRPKEPPRFLTAAVTAFLAVGMTGCGSDQDEAYVYCIDDAGEVVDPDYCEDAEEVYAVEDDDRDSYWYFVSPRRLRLGARVAGDYLTRRVSPSDRSARLAAGLPATGRIGGTTIRVGGFGSGSASNDGSGGG